MGLACAEADLTGRDSGALCANRASDAVRPVGDDEGTAAGDADPVESIRGRPYVSPLEMRSRRTKLVHEAFYSTAYSLVDDIG